jgi:chromate reductase, NAD(P)H dehydrogenase (quinone)
MRKYRIGVLIGSLRRESVNRRVASALALLGPPDLEFAQLEIGDLPLYNQDAENQPIAAVARLKEDITLADGLLFVTPEYNRSIPGVLKNAIDHASRPYGKHVFAGKPAAVLGVSIGVLGTAMAQQHLRNVLAYLDVPTLGQPEVFLQAKPELLDAEGRIGRASEGFLQTFIDRYAAWVRAHATRNA